MFRRQVAPGLEIRHFEMGDAEAIFAVVERNRVYLREWLPWVERTRSADDVRQFISSALEQTEEGRGPQCAIWVAGDLAGSVGCHPIDWPNRSCSLGYWLDKGRQGQGIVTRCCASMVDYLFGELKLHRVEIRCGTGNARSCAIPERLGFTREGVAREAERVNDRWVDLLVWGMLAREWKQYRTRYRPRMNRLTPIVHRSAFVSVHCRLSMRFTGPLRLDRVRRRLGYRPGTV